MVALVTCLVSFTAYSQTYQDYAAQAGENMLLTITSTFVICSLPSPEDNEFPFRSVSIAVGKNASSTSTHLSRLYSLSLFPMTSLNFIIISHTDSYES